MKRILSLLLCLSLGLTLTACGSDTVSCPAADDPSSTGENVVSTTTCWSEAPKSVWTVTDDITISLAQGVYPLGTESFEITLTNTGSQIMLYGESYSFQYNDGSGWRDLETIENYAFNSIGYLLGSGETQTLEVSPWMLTSPLPTGRFRIVGCSLRVSDNADQLSYGGDYTEYPPYELEFDIAENASTPEEVVINDAAFWLEIHQPSPSAERLEFSIVNDSGSDAEVLLIPTLEKMTEDGSWETVPFCDQIGFCGTPDPLPAGKKDWSEDLSYLWGGLADGDYRLSFTVTDRDGNEFTTSGQFTFDDGLCSLPLAE